MLLSLRMHYREAVVADIPQMHTVRNSVKENVLSDPNLITTADYISYLTLRGKGWVCETGGSIVGFAIADIDGNNIWALFLLPEFERRGIGKMLHAIMLDWYFWQTDKTVWLSTAPQSRASNFYRKAGWQEIGIYGKGELKFEMTKTRWQQQKNIHI